MWEVFYLFVDAVLERLHPLVLRFSKGEYAIVSFLALFRVCYYL